MNFDIFNIELVSYDKIIQLNLLKILFIAFNCNCTIKIVIYMNVDKEYIE